MKKRIGILSVLISVLFLCFFSCADADAEAHVPLFPMDTDADEGYISGYGNAVREMRGVYIATAYNIDFPSKKGLSEDELKSELDTIVSTVEKVNANAIFFQVRSASDSMYASDIFPVSEYLTGEVGGELPNGFDPLLYLVNIAHSRGIEVHAWVNPLRVTRGGTLDAPKTDTEALAANDPARLSPYLTVDYVGELYYDPGLPETRALVAAGLTELVEGYDIDGVIFDDYFYPYPETDANGETIEFNDSDTYKTHGGGMALDDWRRENINKLVKMCYEAIKKIDAECRFGIAPFGIWQNDNGENSGSATTGLEAYSSIYCDALAWAEGGYIDYLAPQIYWNFSKESAPYGVIADWWSAKLDGTGVDYYISHAAYKYGTDEWIAADVVDEMTAQIEYGRKLLSYRGSLLYGYSELSEDVKNVATEVTACYENEVIYADAISNGDAVRIMSPEYGMAVTADRMTLVGASDPTVTVSYNGEKICRQRDGGFTLEVELHDGENYFEFYTKYGKYVFMVEKTS